MNCMVYVKSPYFFWNFFRIFRLQPAGKPRTCTPWSVPALLTLWWTRAAEGTYQFADATRIIPVFSIPDRLPMPGSGADAALIWASAWVSLGSFWTLKNRTPVIRGAWWIYITTRQAERYAKHCPRELIVDNGDDVYEVYNAWIMR